MHTLQKKLLNLISERKKLENTGFLEIGRLIGVDSAQQVKHHLLQLERNNFIKIHRNGRKIDVQLSSAGSENFIAVPLVGAANCGAANIFADECLEGYVHVSAKFLPKKDQLFAISAIGSSMNQAHVNGKTIEDGDFVIVDRSETDPQNNEYILSVIDGMANIKKYYFDEKNKQAVLLSESTENIPPIYIHPEDDSSYFVNGKVVDVLKKPVIKKQVL